MKAERKRAVVGKYEQSSISKRIEAFFLDNVGNVAIRSQIQQVARNPKTGQEPENWHQRLSELRTDSGYTILTNRDDRSLKVGEYVLQSTKKRAGAGKRVTCSDATWKQVLKRAADACEWDEDGAKCLLIEGSIDPVGGGTVKLTPDHMTPHSIKCTANPDDPKEWRALCGRHQVMKKNYWDSVTNKLNVYAIVQSASKNDKRRVYEFLKDYFKVPAK
ncbi:MAG: hypothetical protein WB424_02170 [Terracidiphilus sp.]